MVETEAAAAERLAAMRRQHDQLTSDVVSLRDRMVALVQAMARDRARGGELGS